MAAPRLLQRATWGTPTRAPAPRARRQSDNPFDNPPPTTAPTRAGTTTTERAPAPNPFDNPTGARSPSTGSTAAPTAPKSTRPRDDPIRRVQVNVAKLLQASGHLSKPNQQRVERLLADVGQGVPAYEDRQTSERQSHALGYVPERQRADVANIMREVMATPGMNRASIPARQQRSREALLAAGISPGTTEYVVNQYHQSGEGGAFGTAAGSVIRQVMRPAQAVTSGVAEASRQWEDEDKPFSLGEIGRGFREGWNLDRKDTGSSIFREAERIREAQGETTGPILGATNAAIRTVPGAGLVTDMAVGALFDPLTYTTLGTSSLAKGGLRVVEKVTDAATAAQVARRGMKVLTPAQRATVEAWTGPRAFEALERGAQGGIGVRRFMGPQTGRTILPGFIPRAGARAVGSAVERVPVVGRAAQQAGEFLQNVFVPRARLARAGAIGGQNLADNIYQLEARARGFQHAGVDRAVKRLTNAMHKANVTPEEMRTIVGPSLDIGGTGVVAEARLQGVVDRFVDVRQELTDMQVQAGRLLDDVDLEDWMVRTDEYMPHVRTPEGHALWDEGMVPSTPFAKKLHEDPYLTSRELRDMSARDINRTLSNELGRPIQYFDENPLNAFAARARSAYGSVAGDELANGLRALRAPDGSNLVDQWAALPDVVPQGSSVGRVTDVIGQGQKIQRPGYAELKLVDPANGGVHHLSVPSEVAELVNKTWRTIHDPAEVGKLWDQMLQWWKTMATVPLPFGLGFHLRNAESNVALNWMSGVGVNMHDYVRARVIQHQMAKGVRETGDWQQYLSAADRSLMQDALEREVLSTGVLGALDDLPDDPNLLAGYSRRSRSLPQQAGYAVRRTNPLSTRAVWATGGRKMAQSVEENARLAHFLAATRNVGDIDAAAMSVRRWLFDYHDLTRSEQQIKRLIPFYTWSRKASSAVIETVLRDPRKLAQFERLRQSLISSAGADLSSTMVPDYMRESPTAIPFTAPSLGPLQGTAEALGYPDPGTLMYADPDLPINTPFELGNAAYGVLQNAPLLNRVLPRVGNESSAESLRPFFSMLGGPAGLARAGYETVVGQKTFSGAPIRDEYGPAPSPLNLPGISNIFAPGGNMTAAGRNFAEAVWPTIPKIEGIVGNDPKSEDKKWRRIVSIITGIPIAPVDVNTQEAEAYRRLEPIAKLIRDLQAQNEPIG